MRCDCTDGHIAVPRYGDDGCTHPHLTMPMNHAPRLLYAAILTGNYYLADSALARGASPDGSMEDDTHTSPLCFAIERGRQYIATLLLDRGADMHLARGYLIAEGDRPTDQPTVLSPIVVAVRSSNIVMVKELAGRGAALVDSDGLTLVCCAAERGDTAMVRVLAALGATVNDERDPMNVKGSPATYAAVGGHADTLRVLVELGAALNCGWDTLGMDGDTLACTVAWWGHRPANVLQVLADSNVDLAGTGSFGCFETPLENAIDAGNLEAAKKLVLLGVPTPPEAMWITPDRGGRSLNAIYGLRSWATSMTTDIHNWTRTLRSTFLFGVSAHGAHALARFAGNERVLTTIAAFAEPYIPNEVGRVREMQRTLDMVLPETVRCLAGGSWALPVRGRGMRGSGRGRGGQEVQERCELPSSLVLPAVASQAPSSPGPVAFNPPSLRSLPLPNRFPGDDERAHRQMAAPHGPVRALAGVGQRRPHVRQAASRGGQGLPFLCERSRLSMDGWMDGDEQREQRLQERGPDRLSTHGGGRHPAGPRAALQGGTRVVLPRRIAVAS